MTGLEHLLPGKMQRHAPGGRLGLLRSFILQSLVLQSLLLETLLLETLVLETPVPRSGGDAACRASGSELHVAAENGSSQLIPRSGQEQFSAIGTRVLIRPALKLALHIALGKNVIHRVVLPQEERRLVGLQLLPLPRQSHRSEHDL